MPATLSDRDLLARLVAEASVSACSNVPLADLICEYLDRPGVRIERYPCEDAGKVNLVVRAGPEPDDSNHGLTWCGHLDVVPADEPEWESDPFRLTERDDKLYARGACDMKGSIAVAINVLAEESQQSRAAPMAMVLSCDEELGSLGMQHLARSKSQVPPLPRSCIVGEPTSLRVVRMHKGHLKMRIQFRGRSAHSGSPQLGINAIEPAGRAIGALTDLRRELDQLRTQTSVFFPEVPQPVLCIARVSGGDALNVVPERCAIDVGLRLLPGMEAEPIMERVRAIVREVAHPAAGEVTVVNDNPPMLGEEDAAIYRELCRITGQEGTQGVSFASDAGVLQRSFGLECVLFGPGSIEVAHRANEYVPVADMRRAREVLEALVGRQ